MEGIHDVVIDPLCVSDRAIVQPSMFAGYYVGFREGTVECGVRHRKRGHRAEMILQT